MDSNTAIEGMIEAAIDAGFSEIAITDHCDFTWPDIEILQTHPRLTRPYSFCFEQYCGYVQKMQHRYHDKITVLLGCEMGIRHDVGEAIQKITDAHSFDFVLGSMHDFEGLDFSYREFFKTRTKFEAYSEYFELMAAAVDACDFDVLGHMDYIERYAPYSDPTLKYADYAEYIDNVLRKVIAKNRGIELNTGSFNYGMTRPHPSLEILSRYKELGGKIITFGSDAHSPKRLGAHFDEAVELAKQAGFRYFAAFSQRKARMLPL